MTAFEKNYLVCKAALSFHTQRKDGHWIHVRFLSSKTVSIMIPQVSLYKHFPPPSGWTRDTDAPPSSKQQLQLH